LTNNIREFLLQNNDLRSTLSSRLKYLKLAEEYNFEELKEKIFKAETFKELFMDVVRMRQFNELPKNIKLRVARNFLSNKCKQAFENENRNENRTGIFGYSFKTSDDKTVADFDALLTKLLSKDCPNSENLLKKD